MSTSCRFPPIRNGRSTSSNFRIQRQGDAMNKLFYFRLCEMKSRDPRNCLHALICFALSAAAALPVLAHAQVRLEETALTNLNFPDTAIVSYTGKWHQTEALFNWSGGTAAVTNWGLANHD